MPAGLTAGWWAAGLTLEGRCERVADLNEYSWSGHALVVNDEPVAIAPIPTVGVGARSVDLGEYAEVELPSVVIRPGRRREVRLGGRCRPVSGQVEVWVEDGDQIVSMSLDTDALA